MTVKSEMRNQWIDYWSKKKGLALVTLAIFVFYIVLAVFSSSKFDRSIRGSNLSDLGWLLKGEATLSPMPSLKRFEPAEKAYYDARIPAMKTYSSSQNDDALSSQENRMATNSGTNSGTSGVNFVPKKMETQSASTPDSFSTVFKTKFTTAAPVLLTLPPPEKRIPLKDPSIYQVLPFLKNESSLLPAFISSKGRRGVDLVLGIPTVRRDKQNYLKVTLKRILRSMTPEDKNQSLIVIFIAEVDQDYVLKVANEVHTAFSEDMESGLIDILSPPPTFYPDFTTFQPTINDDTKRFIWRSKQNLDYAFLMMYSQSKGKYYMQLEDDILAREMFVSTVLKTVVDVSASGRQWIIIDFCRLGFIGKLFKTTDLAWIIEFFAMFWKDQPCDWLLSKSISTKVCRLDETSGQCSERIKRVWIETQTSLFQHIGIYSSLKGKIQKLKDRHFPELKTFVAHVNPVAKIDSSLEIQSNGFTLEAAYEGRNFFWGKTPKAGDYIKFQFKDPIHVTRFLLKSSNLENPADQLYDTQVVVLSKNSGAKPVLVGSFNAEGVAEGGVPPEINPITEFRLEILKDGDTNVILNEILFETKS